MLVKTYGSAVHGVDAQTITIEVNVGIGTGYFIVGLPDNAVKESLTRVDAALINNDYSATRRKVVVNMAPADIRKEGSAYDLPIAIGLLAATDQVNPDNLDKYIIMGELSLDGGLMPIRGALPIAIQARKEGYKGILLPIQNVREAAIVDKLEVYGIETLKQAVDFLNGDAVLEPTIVNTRDEFYDKMNIFDVDFSDVKGQENIKRSLE